MPTDPRILARSREALRLRLEGLTYGAIGEQVGLTGSRVAQLLAPPPPTRRGLYRRAQGHCQGCGIALGLMSGQAHMPGLDHEEFTPAMKLLLLCPSCHRRAHEDGKTPMMTDYIQKYRDGFAYGRDATARNELLLAAAPDMLAALKELLPWAEAHYPFTHGHAGLESSLAAARAAIERAEE